MNTRHLKNNPTYSWLLTALLLLLLCSPDARAQQSSINLGGSRQSVNVSILPIYQSYDEDGLEISQTSIPLSIMAPIGSNVAVSFLGHRMTTSGDVPDLNGLSDAQIFVSYAARAGSGSMVLSLGTNLPVGKVELTNEEFATNILVSQRAYNFRVSSLGQGLGLSPSLTYALSLGENTALGAGVAYQLRGTYKPFGFLDDEYDPGDELLLTVGVNTRLNAQSGISFDVAHSRYSADTFADSTVYEAGGKTTVSAMYRYVVRFDEVRLSVAYRNRAKNSSIINGELALEDERSIPNQLNLRATYKKRINPGFQITGLIEGRLFSETDLVQKRTMVDLGLLPSIKISSQASVVGRFIYTLGTITGFEAGAGVAMAL